MQDVDFLYLAILLVLVVALLLWRYNHLLLASFNPSLARSRRISLRMNNYLFILLLALIVNFSIVTVGALLINAMLIVPAATASNISRNLRQMFWLTFGLSIAAGLAGLSLSTAYRAVSIRHRRSAGRAARLFASASCCFSRRCWCRAFAGDGVVAEVKFEFLERYPCCHSFAFAAYLEFGELLAQPVADFRQFFSAPNQSEKHQKNNDFFPAETEHVRNLTLLSMAELNSFYESLASSCRQSENALTTQTVSPPKS